MTDERAPVVRSPFDTTVAHAARVYDYWLGGTDHFAADRRAAETVMAVNPGVVPTVRSNRAFMERVVRYLAGPVGIRQFLDLGTGLPAVNSVHGVAQATAEDCRVVYVDYDPIVMAHARALLTGVPGSVSYVLADIREPDAILAEAVKNLDFERPVAVLLLMTLQFITDAERPDRLVRVLVDAVPSGSYLAVSHPASDGGALAKVASQATAQYNELVATPMTRRSREQVARFFDGLEIIEPGLVAMSEWRPDPGEPPPSMLSPAHCAVARKP